MSSSTRSIRELLSLPTFEERFEYLAMSGVVGGWTFGCDRVFNQRFYRSREWRDAREKAIVRDGACDLGVPDRLIFARPTVHHINPIMIEDIRIGAPCLFDPDNLITVSHATHNALHYGDIYLTVPSQPIVRTKNDTCPWKRD